MLNEVLFPFRDVTPYCTNARLCNKNRLTVKPGLEPCKKVLRAGLVLAQVRVDSLPADVEFLG